MVNLKRKPKLVVCDIDSTLVVRHHILTDRAKKCIDLMREKGVYFGIASGRPIYQITSNHQAWGIDAIDLTIGLNGATILDGIDHKEYSYYLMKKEWLKEVIELMSVFDTNPSIYLQDEQLFYKEDETVRHYIKETKLKVRIDENLEHFYAEDNAKIMFRVNEKDMPQVEQWIKEHPSPHYIGFKTQPINMEFCDRRVNKGFALKQFCELHHIDLADVWAFGDTSNDNEMIRMAGLGICMENGSEDTKQIADMITEKPCDEDGWADFVEKYLLPLL